MPTLTLRSAQERALLVPPLLALVATGVVTAWACYPQLALFEDTVAQTPRAAAQSVPSAAPARDETRFARLAASRLFGEPAAAAAPGASDEVVADAPPAIPEAPPEALPLAALGVA
ncbi:MAG: hypothetical protein RLW62_12285, partial [Gammaproteobacteria bacterium]